MEETLLSSERATQQEDPDHQNPGALVVGKVMEQEMSYAPLSLTRTYGALRVTTSSACTSCREPLSSRLSISPKIRRL